MSQSLLNNTALTPQITFNEIPYNWKVPGEYMEVAQAVNANAIMDFPARGLVMGQMYATGTATPGQAYQLLTKDQANGLFGAGSQAALMAAAWLAVNPYTACDVMGIADDATGTAAAGAVAIAGTATAPGTMALYFGGVRVATGVAIGDTAAVVAANLYAQLQLQGQPGYPYLPCLVPAYTAGQSSVTLTCGHKGTLGNDIDIRLNAQQGDAVPAGLTVTITPMAGGATDPAANVQAALDGITTTWYTDVVFAWVDATNLGAFNQWLTPRYGAMEKLDAQGYVGFDGTYGIALAFEPNCKFITDLPVQNPLTPVWISGALMAGACCYSTAQNPSLQMKGVVLTGMVAPAHADRFEQPERQALLLAGHSTFTVDADGNCLLQRVTTTYRTDANGILNGAYFDLSATKTPTRVRYDWNAYCSQMWPRNALAPDGSIAADYLENCATPSRLKASWVARATLYERKGWLQNTAALAPQSSFTIDPNDDNRVNAAQPIKIMGNLYVLAGQLQFIS